MRRGGRTVDDGWTMLLLVGLGMPLASLAGLYWRLFPPPSPKRPAEILELVEPLSRAEA